MQSHSTHRARPTTAGSASPCFRAVHLFLLLFAVAVPVLQGRAQFGTSDAESLPLPVGTVVGGVCAVDYNGDGSTDWAVLDQTRGVLLFESNGIEFNLVPGTLPPLAAAALAFAPADFNLDGFTDFAIGGAGPNALWLGDGWGNFSDDDTPDEWRNDTNQTVDVEIVSLQLGGRWGVIFGNDGGKNSIDLFQGTKLLQTTYLTPSLQDRTQKVAVSEPDSFGSRIMLTYNFFNRDRVHRLDRNLNATDVTDTMLPNHVGASTDGAVFDANGDGRPDFFVTENGGPNRLFLNDGNRFTESGLIGSTSGATEAAAVGDWDCDGVEDLITLDRGERPAIRYGDGSGGFDLSPSFMFSYLNPVAIHASDWNGTGYLDVAVAGRDKVHVYNNRNFLFSATPAPRVGEEVVFESRGQISQQPRTTLVFGSLGLLPEVQLTPFGGLRLALDMDFVTAIQTDRLSKSGSASVPVPGDMNLVGLGVNWQGFDFEPGLQNARITNFVRSEVAAK